MTNEKEFLENLNKKREKWRKEGIDQREREAHTRRIETQDALNEKLKPLEEQKMEEIQKVRHLTKERIDGITEQMWEENEEYLRIQGEFKRRHEAELERDLDLAKGMYEEELKKLVKGSSDVEKKINQTEIFLEDISEKQLDNEINKTRRQEDFERNLTNDKRALEMGQIKDHTEMSFKQLEIRAKAMGNLNNQEEVSHERILQHRQEIIQSSADHQRNIVNLTILDFEGEKTNAVNTELNIVKTSQNEIHQYFLECSEQIDAITRDRNVLVPEEPLDLENVEVKSETESSSSTAPEESRKRKIKKPAIKKSNIQKLDIRLRNLRNQLGDLKAQIDTVERKLSKTEYPEELLRKLKEIKTEIARAQSLITEFCSYTGSKKWNWEESKVEELKISIRLISESVNSLDSLRNQKQAEKEALLQEQTKKLEENKKALN